MDSFANRLRQALDARNMSQSELARQSGIGRNSISDYLKGKYEAKQNKLNQLSRALMVNEAWLLGYENVEMEKPNIVTIYNQLTDYRQKNVYDYAADQLNQQHHEADANENKVTHLPKKSDDDEPDYLMPKAAHIDGPITDEDREQIDAFMKKIEKEHKDQD